MIPSFFCTQNLDSSDVYFCTDYERYFSPTSQQQRSTVSSTNLSMITADPCLTPYHFLERWNSNWHSSIMQLWSPTKEDLNGRSGYCPISSLYCASLYFLWKWPPVPTHGFRLGGHNLRTNDFECPEPSFDSRDARIDFLIRPAPTILSVFYIKTCTNGHPW